MSTPSTPRHDLDLGQERRLTTETKSALKTTEFFVFVAMVLAVVITANVYDGNGNGNGDGGDPFGAATAMRYVVYLTIGYLVARGLAKSGSRERYDA